MELTEILQSLEAEVTRITAESTERYNALVAAQSDLNNANATIASLQNQLANMPTGGTTVSDLQPALNAANEQIAVLTNDLASAASARDAALAERDAAVLERDNANAAAAQREADLDAFAQSK